MEKHVLMFLGNDLAEVYAVPSPRNARRFCVGVQVYKPSCQAFMKTSECQLPAADGLGIAFEFERALDKCTAAGFAFWPQRTRSTKGGFE